MQKTLAEIALIVDGEVVGNGNLLINGLCGIEKAQEGQLTFVSNPKYLPLIEKTKASAILVGPDIEVPGKSIIRVKNPSLAFAIIGSSVSKEKPLCFEGIHGTAIISDDVSIGANVTVGPYAIIEPRALIGDGSIIYGGTYIGHDVKIGANCVLHPHVVVREEVVLGDRVIVHSGTVIGSDGFGYEPVDGTHQKIPQLGTVEIQDDVEIGANVTIDRARFHKTVIGRGTKIDNLVQIAHNVIIGENSIIAAQVGIAGSTKVGKGCIFGGQAGISGHLSIGDGCIVAAQAGLTRSLPPKIKVSGYPARPHDKAGKVNACVQRLPHYVRLIQELKAKVEDLEEKLNQDAKTKNN